MFKHTLLALSFAILAPSAALFADKPKTFLGKIGSSIVQTLNKHPYVTSCALGLLIGSKCKSEGLFWSIWLLGGIGLEAGTQALMKNFEIEQLAKFANSPQIYAQ